MPPSRSSRQASSRPGPSRRRIDSEDEGSGSDGDRRGGHSRRDARAAPAQQRRRGVDDDEARAANIRASRAERQSHVSLAAPQAMDVDDEDEEEGGGQRRLRRRRGNDEEEDEDDDDNDARHAPIQHAAWRDHLNSLPMMNVTERAKNVATSMGKHEVKLYAHDLVRMALFAQLRNAPIRREDITKKVLNKTGGKDYSAALPVVFNRAQQTLRYTFGYEMTEMRTRGADNEQVIRAQTQAQTMRDGSQEQSATQGTRKTYAKMWMLRSVLPSKIIERMNKPQENLAECVTRANTVSVNKGRDPEGVLLDWKYNGSELGSMGLLFLVLGLVLINGRTLADGTLRSYLRRMSLEPSQPLPKPLQPRRGSDVKYGGKLTIEEWLDELVRHAYLERIRSNAGGNASAATHLATLDGRRTQARGSSSRAKNRRSGGGDDENASGIEWRWGGRAEAEITETAVSLFVTDIFLGNERTGRNAAAAARPAQRAGPSGGRRGRGRDAGADEDDEQEQEEARLTEAERRRKRKEYILHEIERVVGTPLIK